MILLQNETHTKYGKKRLVFMSVLLFHIFCLNSSLIFLMKFAQWTAMQFASWIRGQWAIENKLHCVADVIFREDKATNRMGHSAENLTLIRKIVMNMVNTFDPSLD
jgi:hypothetical protein